MPGTCPRSAWHLSKLPKSAWHLPKKCPLTDSGHLVFKSEVPAVESIAVGAEALRLEIDGFRAEAGVDKVHIIAHSMGGLDSRYLISSLGYGDNVISLSTISTPHHGTPLADLALGLQESSGQTQDAAGEGLAQLLEGTPFDPAAFQRGVTDLAEANALAFNAANPDAAGIAYLSYAGLSAPGSVANENAAAVCDAAGAAVPEPDALRPLLWLPGTIISGADARPNDGVVPVDSAIWGDYRGCIAADHIDENGALDTGNSGIDAPAFYVTLAAELATL